MGLAHLSNSYAPKHMAVLATRRLHLSQLLATCAEDMSQEFTAQVEKSVELLEHLEAEIESADTSNPTTVGFLRGDVARLSAVGFLLMALMYNDVQMLLEKMGIDSDGLPFR